MKRSIPFFYTLCRGGVLLLLLAGFAQCEKDETTNVPEVKLPYIKGALNSDTIDAQFEQVSLSRVYVSSGGGGPIASDTTRVDYGCEFPITSAETIKIVFRWREAKAALDSSNHYTFYSLDELFSHLDTGRWQISTTGDENEGAYISYLRTDYPSVWSTYVYPQRPSQNTGFVLEVSEFEKVTDPFYGGDCIRVEGTFDCNLYNTSNPNDSIILRNFEFSLVLKFSH